MSMDEPTGFAHRDAALGDRHRVEMYMRVKVGAWRGQITSTDH